MEFDINKSLILKLPELNANGLYYLLKNKQFKVEGKALMKENITGKDFISILSNLNGLPILKDDFNFSFETIEKLKILYLEFYRFRRETLKQFLEDERPFYWFTK